MFVRASEKVGGHGLYVKTGELACVSPHGGTDSHVCVLAHRVWLLAQQLLDRYDGLALLIYASCSSVSNLAARDFNNELDAILHKQSQELTYRATSLHSGDVANKLALLSLPDEVVNEAQEAGEAADTQTFLSIKKKMHSDWKLWAGFITQATQDEKARGTAIVLHARTQQAVGEQIARGWMAKNCKIVYTKSKDELGRAVKQAGVLPTPLPPLPHLRLQGP